jgi:chemotaxis protein MotB
VSGPPGDITPIIIKKVRKSDHGHHGGAWKVAYADMVTALMALFIVLWILSQSDQTIQSVAGYFRDPVGFVDGGAAAIIEGGTTSGKLTTVISGSQPASETTPLQVDDPDERWQERARRIRGALERTAGIESLPEHVEISMTPAGLQITLIETTNQPLFEVGGVQLNPEAAKLLRTIGAEISRIENHVTIEGHTDSLAFGSGDGSNWELSTGRALAARKILEASGFPPKRIFEVRGLADRLLYNPLDPQDSRNRRISITLLSEAAYRNRLEQFNESALFEELIQQ